MEIKTNLENEVLTINVIGRLDTITSPELDKVLQEQIPNCSRLVFDFAELEYISSAGLRIVLQTQRQMSAKNGMLIKNVQDAVYEVFDITGFTEILTIQK